MSSDELNYLQRQINSIERRLSYLRKQIAQQGGEVLALVNLLGQRDELEEQLMSLTQRQALTGSVTKLPAPQPPRPLLRVFIGATPREMEAERQGVQQALAELTLAPVELEVIGSQAVLPDEIEQIVAQQADIYIGLFGNQPGPTISGGFQFVADLEVETMVKLGRPLLLYDRIGGIVDPEQADFLTYLRHPLPEKATWREFEATDAGRAVLQAWVKQDVQRIVAEQPEGPWMRRPLVQGRVLLASLGLAPGAVTGLYHALERAGQPVSRVVTMAPNHEDIRAAVGICQTEFERIGVPYRNQALSIKDIQNDNDAREFKDVFAGLLRGSLDSGAEVVVGVTGGRTVMGTLMATTVQAMNLEQVSMCYLSVDEDIEEKGRLPRMWDFEYDEETWRKLLDPEEAASLVRIPYLRYD